MILSMLIIFIAAVCITGLLGLGMLLIWSGLRGKTIDRHPLCGNCNFDLIGHAIRPDHCPECGAIIARIGGIQIGHRRLQVPKIMHGSFLMLINLSIVGFCCLTADQPAAANAVAITPTIRIMPISLTISTLSQAHIDVQTVGSSITIIAAPSTIALNVDAMSSSGLIIGSDYDISANSLTLNQLLLLDKHNKLLGLPAQPAAGVIEAHIYKGVIGMAHRPIDRGRGKSAIYKSFKANSKVSNRIETKRMDTNKINAQLTGHIAIGQ